MRNINHYTRPGTPKEVLKILLNKKAKAMAVAGGTLVAKTLPETVETYIDLKGLPLGHIKKTGEGLVIGAMATFDEIDNSKIVRQWAGGVLAQAAARCSSQLIRNMATIGGNIARPHSFNIFPVVLAGLGAKVRILSRAGVRLVDFEAIYSADFALSPGRDCLILEVIVPAKTKNWRCCFEKFAKTESSWEAYLTLFAGVDMAKRTVKEVRVAVGALSPKPFRALSVEKMLAGAALTPALIDEAAIELARDMDVARAVDFKKEVAANLMKRFLSGV